MKAVYVPPGYDPTQYEPPSRSKGGCGRWLWIIGVIFGVAVGFGLGIAGTYHAAPAPHTNTPVYSLTPGPTPTPTRTPTITPTPGPITATPGVYDLTKLVTPNSACYFTVQAGDMLSAIAAFYHTTTAELMKQNNIPNANIIRVGQRLKIPCGGPTP